MHRTSLPVTHTFFLEANAPHRPWWKSPGGLGSLALHAAGIAALWALSQHLPTPQPVDRAIELVMEKIVPPSVVAPPQPDTTPKPLALAPPKPQSAARPQPKTVETSAAQAETYTPPHVDTAVPAIAPVEPGAPAPAVVKPGPPAPRVISNDGIPTDYVSQVYSRINRNTSYPRGARVRHEEGRVGYRLTLSPQGELLRFDLQSSGNEDLDEAARSAIKAAAPFPRLPDLGGSSYLLAGVIAFKLN